MKKLLFSSVTLLGLTAGALAADLPYGTVVAPAPFVPVPVFTWTGFYVGANAGYGFSDRNSDDFGGSGLSVLTNAGLAPVLPLSGFNNFGFDDRRNRDGFVGGGQIGYNFQLKPGSGWVIGIEADAQYADFGRRRNNNDFFGFGGGTNFFTAAPVQPLAAGSGSPAPPGLAAARLAMWRCSRGPAQTALTGAASTGSARCAAVLAMPSIACWSTPPAVAC